MALNISSDLFPSKKAFIVFVAYISLFVGQGIFVTASQESMSSAYKYNTTTLVMLTELSKLFVAVVLFVNEVSFRELVQEVRKNKEVLLYYVVPSLMYAVYNNLTFYNLSVFDPTTYYVLLQLRVVLNGIIFQRMFNKSLSRKQWISLVLLTIGCIIKQIDPPHKPGTQAINNSSTHAGLLRGEEDGFSTGLSHTAFALCLLGLQMICSVFAGVYNEYLLKDRYAEVHLMVQNVFMYVDSVAVNLVFLGARGDLSSAFTSDALASIAQWKPLLVLATNAAIGIVTSLFLKHLNSILKSYASIMELMFTALLAWVLFGIPINTFTVLSVAVVSYAMVLYAQNPVVNRGRLDEVERKAASKESPGATDASAHIVKL